MSEPNFSEEFLQALQALSEWLEGERISHVAIGGVAVSFAAQPRVTQDIDAVIWLPDDLWDEFLRSGQKYGIVPRLSNALDFARRSRVLLLTHQATKVNIDLSCGALPFEQEMIERALTVRLDRLSLKVATPEDLIITKALAGRPKDLIDVDAIFNIAENLDRERIRYWVKQFADVMEMPEIMENLAARLGTAKTAKPRPRRKLAKRRSK